MNDLTNYFEHRPSRCARFEATREQYHRGDRCSHQDGAECIRGHRSQYETVSFTPRAHFALIYPPRPTHGSSFPFAHVFLGDSAAPQKASRPLPLPEARVSNPLSLFRCRARKNNRNRQIIVVRPSFSAFASGDLLHVSGWNVLSNEQVNALSVRKGGMRVG